MQTNKYTTADRFLAQMHDAIQKAEAATTPFMIRMYEKRAAEFAGKFYAAWKQA